MICGRMTQLASAPLLASMSSMVLGLDSYSQMVNTF